LAGVTLSTSGHTSTDIPLKVLEDGQYEIFLKVAHAPNRGELSVEMDGETLLSNYRPEALHALGFRWTRLRTVHLTKGEHTLTLTNDGSGSNDIDIIALIPTSKLHALYEEITKNFQNTAARIVIILEAEDSFTGNVLSTWQTSHRWGGRASNGYTLLSKTAAEASTQFYIPRAGNYKIGIRVAKGPAFGNLFMYLDRTEKFNIPCNSTATEFTWHEVGPISLSQEDHTLKVINDGQGEVEIDELVIYSLKEGEEDPPLSSVFSSEDTTGMTYTQISPVEYVAHVKSESPFWLIFSESHHPLWKAYIDDQEIPSTVAYSFLNGFHINRTGEFDVKIYFRGQDYAMLGGMVSLTTWIIVLLYLTYPKIRGLRMAAPRSRWT
ncbi:MAG: hypothetical protein ACE5Z5_12640, partial [Candidatus Bathyarchaeia archaeon]